MELKPGYKQTEVGVIPEDWEIREINQLCVPSNVRINPLTTITNYKCIELEHLSQGTGQLLGFADSNQLKSQKTVFKTGDVLFGKLRPYLKKYFFPEFDGVCTTEIWVLHASLGVVNRWLYFIVQSDRFLDIANQSTGTKMPRAEWSIVRKALIPLPPTKAEQIAIASALSDADALIQSLTTLIAKKRQIKQGAMQTLLNPYENGQLKEGWVVKSILELADNKKELFDDGDWIESEHITSKGIRLIQTGNIGVGQYVEKEAKKYIYETSFEKLHCKPLRKGDLLICRLAEPAGRACVLPDIGETKIVTSVDVTIFRPRKDVANRIYLANLFSTPDWFKKVNESVGGTTHKRISRGSLGKIEIAIPNIEKQNATAIILSDMDAEIAALEAKLAKYRHIKQGMMQNLLTGRIRLVKPESKTGVAA